MSIEINRFIRQLQEVADNHSGNDLFVKVFDENGDLVDPDKKGYSYDNDHSDRLVIIDGA